MRKRRGVIRFAVIIVLVALSTYFATYLTFVRREPVHYGGNKLRQISLSVSLAGAVSPPPSSSPPPDSYRPVYPFAGERAETFFAPAHWIDSCLRRAYWPLYDRRRQAC